MSQGGAKTFILKHANRRITIGRYPILSLAEARIAAKRLLAEFTLGHLRPRSLPYQQAVTLFLSDKIKSKRQRTVDDYARHLNKHFPFTGQLSDVSHAEVVFRLKRLGDRPAEYNHALTVGKIFFNWCLKRRLVTENPFFGITPNATVSRSRVLTDSELVQVWHAAEHAGVFGTIVRLLMLTGQRRGEIAALKVAYIDAQALTVTLPASLTKNGREHTFPFERLMAEVVNAIPGHSRPFLLSADFVAEVGDQKGAVFAGSF